MLKPTLPLFLLAAALVATPAHAVPSLQLDIAGGAYDTNTEDIVTDAATFTLGAIYTDDAELTPGQTYVLSFGIQGPSGPLASGDTFAGSFEIDGTTYTAADLDYGTPTGLQTHGRFPTLFQTITFTFLGADAIQTYNTADDPGGWTLDANGGSLVVPFSVDRTLLGPDYQIHFDLFTADLQEPALVHVVSFAPFSHDATGNCYEDCTDGPPPPPQGLPEPLPLALVGLGLIGLGLLRRLRRA